MKETISVIIPIYNVEKYLEKCLMSVINQTYKNLEIICVYDISQDKSLAITENFAQKDSRIKIIKNEELGLGGARNTGTKHATGEYILFVDSDDFLEKDLCERAICAFEKNDDIDYVVYQADEVDIDNNKIDNNLYEFGFDGMLEMNENQKLSVSNVSWNKIYKKSLIDRYNILFPEKTIMEDVCFWWKYSTIAKRAFFIKDVLYHKIYRLDNITNSSADKAAKQKAVFVIIDDLYSFFEKNNLFDKHYLSFLVFICSQAEMNLNFEGNERNVYLDKFSEFIKSKKTLSEMKNNFVKNMIEEKYSKIPELNINSFFDKIFSYKKGVRRFVLYFLGLKITKNF